MVWLSNPGNRSSLNGLANVTVEQLEGVGAPIDESATVVDDDEIQALVEDIERDDF